MNKSTLAVSLKEALPKDIPSQAAANRIVDYIFSSIEDAVVKGEEVSFAGFGSFTTVKKSARTGRNPQTGETVKIPAKTVPKFRPASKFKDAVN